MFRAIRGRSVLGKYSIIGAFTVVCCKCGYRFVSMSY
nr:MAG TPA: PhnA Zinc-Ribbon [Caudoviricetes sp.]